MRHKIEANPGDDFTGVSERAKELSFEKSEIVEFDFNGITCLVGVVTNLDYLYRDYHLRRPY